MQPLHDKPPTCDLCLTNTATLCRVRLWPSSDMDWLTICEECDKVPDEGDWELYPHDPREESIPQAVDAELRRRRRAVKKTGERHRLARWAAERADERERIARPSPSYLRQIPESASTGRVGCLRGLGTMLKYVGGAVWVLGSFLFMLSGFEETSWGWITMGGFLVMAFGGVLSAPLKRT